jgi:alpha-L-rhamnosidase
MSRVAKPTCQPARATSRAASGSLLAPLVLATALMGGGCGNSPASGGGGSGGVGAGGSSGANAAGATGPIVAGTGGLPGGSGSASGGGGGTVDSAGAAGSGAGSAGSAGVAGTSNGTPPLGVGAQPWPAPLTESLTGKWIWRTENGPANSWSAFRKKVTLSSVPVSARALIAADSKYWLWINGEQVVFEGGLKRGPNTTDSYVDEVDLAPHLSAGDNTIAVLVWFFGKDGFSHTSSGKGGLFFQASAGDTTIVSDESWKVRAHAAYGPQTLTAPNYRLSESNVEYDAQKDIGNWTAATFDDAGWVNASAKGSPPVAPWGRLWPRGIPLFRQSGIKQYTNQSSLPASGTGAVIRARLPYNAQVTPYLHVNAASAGAVIALKTDRSDERGGASVRARYITRSGDQEYESLGWMSGNEVQYTIPAGVQILGLGYRESGYDADLSGTFTCSDTKLNTLWTKSQRTLYLNMRDSYTDCPTRERALWWGDAVIEIEQAFYALDRRADFLGRNAINTLIGWQRNDKTMSAPVPGNYDTELPVQILASIGMSGFWTYYLHSGDLAAMTAAYPQVKSYLSIWKRSANGLVVHRAGGWDWSDWGTNIDVPLLDNAWYYMALDGAARMAEATGKAADAAEYRAIMATLKTAFRKEFWNGTRLASPGHTGAPDDRGHGLAVVAGLLGAEEWPAVKKVLASSTYASPYMEKYNLEAYFRMGDAAGGLQRMRSRYATMIDSSSTTLYEHWDPSEGTLNHAWSGGPLTLLSEFVAGIMPTTPGYATYQVLPQLGDLSSAKASVPSVKGTIDVDIAATAGKFSITLTSPPDTTATVGIPTAGFSGSAAGMQISVNGTDVFASGAFKPGVTGVMSATESAGYVKLVVAPGKWSVVASGSASK